MLNWNYGKFWISIFVMAFFGVASVGVAAPAIADQVYHSERLELAPVAADEEGQGQVINIHANGPVIGAMERYKLTGASPSTDYAVWIQFCLDDGAYADFTQTQILQTDAQGNGHAKAGFSAADLEPFSGAVVDVRWVLRNAGVDSYATPCTTVTID